MSSQDVDSEEEIMQVYTVLWIIVCLIIGVLALLLIRALRETGRATEPGVPGPPGEEGGFEEEAEPLFFYYDEVEPGVQSLRSGALLLRVPPAAWEADWRDDLLRVEVTSQDPASYPLAAGVEGHLECVYRISAIRMSERGTDFEVTSFPHPLDLVLIAEEEGGERTGARVMQWADGVWKPLPRAEVPSTLLESLCDPTRRCWAAARVESLGVFGLVR